MRLNMYGEEITRQRREADEAEEAAEDEAFWSVWGQLWTRNPEMRPKLIESFESWPEGREA